MVSLAHLFAAGASALRRRPGTLLGLYAVHMLFALAFLLASARSLSATFGAHPGFSRGVAGDLPALADAVFAKPGVLPAMIYFGLGLAFVYFVVSLFLHGGVLERLRSDDEGVGFSEGARRFAAGGAFHFARMARLWAWSLLLWVPALFVLAMGGAAMGRRDELTFAAFAGKLALCFGPGLVLLALVSLVVDLARVSLVADETLPAGRALRRGLRLVRNPRALALFAAYLAGWLLVSGIYVALTAGRPYAGTGGAFALFLLRQAVVLARLSLRLGTSAGQTALVAGG